MSAGEFILADGAARIYEDQKVPNVFAPLAAATLRHLPPLDGDRILDLACGTGILARTLRERAPAETSIVGADRDGAMLAVAAEVADPAAGLIEWHEANVMDLPFADGAFSKLYCQQGFQFFPDEIAALGEMRRVLQPGGRLCMTIWKGDSELFEPIAEVLGRHFDGAMAAKAMLPFSYRGRDGLMGRIAEAGFAEISREDLPIDRLIEDTHDAIDGEIAASPVAVDLAPADPDLMRRIVGECREALSRFREDGVFKLRQTADIYLATASG
ncbi:MAG: methyltransferase domain-containing protein [Magnetovibrio sp.]|nr:methyltransferase domain-containing protein [Magnetovibrio sp.]